MGSEIAMQNDEVDSIEQAVVEARRLMRDGDCDAANRLLRPWIDALPQDARILAMHAEILEMQKDWTNAARLRRAILQENPEDVADCCLLAHTLRNARCFDESDEILKPLLMRSPNCEPVLAAYAWNAHDRSDLPEAALRWRKLLARVPENVSANCCFIAALTHDHRFEEAETAGSGLTKKYPNNIEVLSVVAWISHIRGDWAEAVNRWRRVTQAGPERADAFACLGTALQVVGRPEDAEIAFGRATALAPANLLFQINYAAIAYDRGDRDEAEARWTALRAANEHDPTAIGTIGFHYNRTLLRIIDSDNNASDPPAFRSMSGRRELFTAFESLGDNCEFGDIQRRFGAEPLGLLRFVQIGPADLIAALEQRFEGVGEPASVRLSVSEHGEYVIHDSAYSMEMHSFVDRKEISEERFYQRALRRVVFLKDKMIADLSEGRKIFVYKSRIGLTPLEISKLWRAIRSYGKSGHLLCVRLADEAHSSGMVETPEEGLIVAYICRFGFAKGFSDVAVDEWVAICERAYAISTAWKSNSAGSPVEAPPVPNQTSDSSRSPQICGAAVLVRDVAVRRRFLVVVRSGGRSLVGRWFSGSLPRTWDLMLSHYEKSLCPGGACAEIVSEGGMSKFAAVRDIDRAHPDLFVAYDAILFLDDDILIEHAEIDVLFSTFADNDMLLAQPSLTSDSFLSWPITARDHSSLVRFTDFVEIMMPLMSRGAFIVCADTFCESISGWGLDYVWPKLLGYPFGKIGIIDAVAARHTQEIDVKGGRFYKYLASLGINPINEANSLMTKHGLEWESVRKPQVLGRVPNKPAGSHVVLPRRLRYEMGDISSPPVHRGIPYLEVLGLIAKALEPTSYFEIGTEHGPSLEIFRCDALCVDPKFKIDRPIFHSRQRTAFYQMTSDEFFSNYNLKEFFPGGPDVCFLDGLHRFEFLLRDFINTERQCHSRSLILLHDCVPSNSRMAERVFIHDEAEDFSTRGAWAGDAWRILPILRTYRPDLRICILDCPPTGIVAVSNLDPQSEILLRSYYEAVDAAFGHALDDAALDNLWHMFPMVSTHELAEHIEDLTALFGIK
jgi:Flp pilus assembly protein TadD